MRAWRMKSMSCVARRRIPLTMMPGVFGNGIGTEIETSPPPVVRAGPPLPFTHAVSPMRVPSSGGTQRRGRALSFRRLLACSEPRVPGVKASCFRRERDAQPESLLSLFLPPTIQQRSVGRDDLDPSLPEHSTPLPMASHLDAGRIYPRLLGNVASRRRAILTCFAGWGIYKR